jgi:hypothetical protein
LFRCKKNPVSSLLKFYAFFLTSEQDLTVLAPAAYVLLVCLIPRLGGVFGDVDQSAQPC